MLNLLLAASFTAFFSAAINPLYISLENLIGYSFSVIRAITAVCLGSLGTYLVDIHNIKYFIINSIAAAFIGSVLVIIAERLNSYAPSIIHSVGNDR